ncbi:MAG: hypothetical protein RL095_2952 [Verrucomicrobiota bacterium]|jgi:hypothetical protein
MIKKFSCLLALSLGLAASAATNEELTERLPENCNMVMTMDIEKLLAIPAVKKQLDDKAGMMPEQLAQMELAKKLGFGPDSLERMVIGMKVSQSEVETGKQPEMAAILSTKKPMDLAAALTIAKADAKAGITVEEKKYQGTACYVITKADQPFPVVVAQLSPTTAVLGTKNFALLSIGTAKAGAKSLAKNKAVMTELGALKGLFGLYFALTEADKAKMAADAAVAAQNGQANPMSNMAQSFQGFTLNADYANNALSLDGVITCKDANGAMGMAGMAQMGAMFLADPKIGVPPGAYKAAAEGNKVKISLALDQAVLDKMAANAKNAQAGGLELTPDEPVLPAGDK